MSQLLLQCFLNIKEFFCRLNLQQLKDHSSIKMVLVMGICGTPLWHMALTGLLRLVLVCIYQDLKVW